MRSAPETHLADRQPGTSIHRDLQQVRSLARLMDRSIGLPGTKFRIGLDGLIGLIPGVGDLAGIAPLGYFIYVASKHRLPKRLYLKMAANQGIDFLIGTIPLLGDLFDFAFKSHAKNARLLEAELAKRIPPEEAARVVEPE